MNIVRLPIDKDSLSTIGKIGDVELFSAVPALNIVSLQGIDGLEIVEAMEDAFLEFFDIDKITDVLSYPAADFASPLKLREGTEGFLRDDFSGLFQLGEIIICRPVCEAQAREFGHSVEREMGYLFVHGVLHLLGFDHDTDEKYRQMRIVEEKVLARVGLKA